jgi:hypothetical protein
MSIECEYPVTILGNPRETIDVSEFADFSGDQRQRPKAEEEPKKIPICENKDFLTIRGLVVM